MGNPVPQVTPGQDGTEQNGTGWDGTGRDGMGQNGTGRGRTGRRNRKPERDAGTGFLHDYTLPLI